MFTNERRQEERTGKYGTPRQQYLQEVVSQFQNAEDDETKEKTVANLANFAYDPYNYTILRQLNVLELFLDCITEPNEKLVEFGIGGVCNACADPENSKVIAQCGGVELAIQCLSSPVRNTVNYALGVLYYLCEDGGNKHQILKDEVVELIKRKLNRNKQESNGTGFGKIKMEINQINRFVLMGQNKPLQSAVCTTGLSLVSLFALETQTVPMAAQGTSPPATSPPSGSNSQSSSTHPISHPLVTAPSPSLLAQPSHHQEGAAANNAVKEEVNVKPDIGVKLEPAVSPKAEEVDILRATEPESSIHLSTQQLLASSDAESEESIKKYKKYEADYSNLLMAKYFSNKDIYGDDIFEVNFPIDDASIRASRWPCMRSYADPLQSYTQPKESTSPPDAGMIGNTANGLVMEE